MNRYIVKPPFDAIRYFETLAAATTYALAVGGTPELL